MANYATLKAAIRNVVKTNGNNEITGELLQSVLISLVDSVGAGYQFMGVAKEETNPGTPDYNVIYIAGPGTYPNFGSSYTVPSGAIGVFKYNGTWQFESVPAGKDYDLIIGTAGTFTLPAAEYYSGMYYSGSAIAAATQYTDGVVFPIEKDVQYSVSPGYTCRLFTEYPVIGGSLGIEGNMSGFTAPFDGYALVSIAKSIPTFTLTKGETGLLRAVNELMSNQSEFLGYKPYVDVVKNLGWGYKFNGTNASCELRTPIVLSQNGDSLELELSVNETGTGGYAFGTTPRSTKGGFAISRDVLMIVGDTGSDNIYLNSALPSVQEQTIKIEYVNNTIKVYRNGTLLGTYNGQKTISILGIGHGWNGSYGYWDGTIKSIKVNGTIVDLGQIATLTNVELYRADGFLTPEQAATFQSIISGFASINVYVDLIRELGWGYKFNGTDGQCVLNSPIVLSQDGDTLEFQLTVNESDTGGYAFATTGRSTKGGFGISRNVLFVMGDTGSDTMFLDGALPSVEKQTIKIEYTGGNVNFYRNGTLLHTYTGQKTISLYGFGHGWNGSYGYWAGVIESIKVNGADYDLAANSVLTNVGLYRQSGFLTDEQAKQLLPSIVVSKDSSTAFRLLIVNRGTGQYLAHTFSKHINSRTIDGVEYQCMNIWNADDVLFDGSPIFQGNFNMIYRVGSVNGVVASNPAVNEDYHVGSTHGCEVLEFIKFFADGKEIDPTQLTDDLNCSVFRIVAKSKCYVVDSSYNSGNSNNYPKIVDGSMVENGIHYIDAVYRENNVITWKNRFIQTRDAAVQYTMMNAAMAQASIPESNVDIILNDAENSWNNVKSENGVISYNIPAGYSSISLATKTRKANTVIMSRAGFILHQQMTNDDNQMRTHGRIYITNNNQTSVKCYLSPIITYGETSPDTINKDDEISAILSRCIEFNLQ